MEVFAKTEMTSGKLKSSLIPKISYKHQPKIQFVFCDSLKNVFGILVL